MTTVAYFVHGRGRGHGARAGPCVAALRAAGHKVYVAGGGGALDLLGDDVDRIIRPVLPRADFPVVGVLRFVADLRWLRAIGARLVVTDGDAPGLHAAAVLRLPSIAVGHGLASIYCRAHPGLPARGAGLDRFKSWSSAWLATRRVGVHFLPIEPLDSRTLVARAELDESLAPAASETDKIVAYFRGGDGADVLRALAESQFRVVCFGSLEGTPGVEARPFERKPFLGAVMAARAVVCSAGSNLLAEAIMLGKPVLALHHARDYEQAANAALVQDAGLGVAATFEADAHSLADRFLEWIDGVGARRLELRSLMPPVSQVVAEVVDELCASP